MTPEDLRKAAEILEIAAHALNPPASTMMRLAAGLRAMADAEPVAWGEEGWESLAWALCAEEHGEEACTQLIWSGGPIPEPWGDRWMKYEDEAKRMIALVQKHTAPQRPQWAGLTDWEVQEVVTSAVKAKKLSWLGFKKDNKGEYTIPALSPSDYQFATAIESALRAKNGGAA